MVVGKDVHKSELDLRARLLNAAGSLGFAPDLHQPIDWTRLGAFVTNPISLRKRLPASGSRMIGFAGGFLLHTGHPNMGLSGAIQQYRRRWSQAPLPIVIHLLAESEKAVTFAIERLEELEGVLAVELGMPPDVDEAMTRSLTQAAIGELPILVRLTLDQASMLARPAIDAGAAALSLGPPRGALLGPAGQIVHGRLYGPAVYPRALAVVHEISKMGLPVIGAGGVYSSEDAQNMLDGGAIAVQLDSALWLSGDLPGSP